MQCIYVFVQRPATMELAMLLMSCSHGHNSFASNRQALKQRHILGSGNGTNCCWNLQCRSSNGASIRCTLQLSLRLHLHRVCALLCLMALIVVAGQHHGLGDNPVVLYAVCLHGAGPAHGRRLEGQPPRHSGWPFVRALPLKIPSSLTRVVCNHT